MPCQEWHHSKESLEKLQIKRGMCLEKEETKQPVSKKMTESGAYWGGVEYRKKIKPLI